MVASSKYIAPLNLMDWLPQPHWNRTGISVIWKAVFNSMPIIRERLTWRIQSGTSVRTGLDPWIGCNNAHMLPEDLKRHLINAGITHISHIADMQHTTFLQHWKMTRSLNTPQHWRQHWEDYTATLIESHIRIVEGEDEIIWAHAKNGIYSPKEGYLCLANIHRPQVVEHWWKNLWKLTLKLRR